MFWFSAQLVSQAIPARDDWRIAADWPEGWPMAATVAGVVSYAAMVRLAWLLAGRTGLGRQARRRFLVPYVAGALALVACAALRPGDGSALEAGLTVGLAPLGYAWAVTRPSLPRGGADPLGRSWTWIGAAVTGLVITAPCSGRA